MSLVDELRERSEYLAANEIENLIDDISKLQEQLAAREAKCSGCFECENDHFPALREHEARLLEEMAQKFIGRLQKPWTAVEISDLLQQEAAARRTK